MKSIFKENQNTNAASFLEAATSPSALHDHIFCLNLSDEGVSLRHRFVPMSAVAFPTIDPAL